MRKYQLNHHSRMHLLSPEQYIPSLVSLFSQLIPTFRHGTPGKLSVMATYPTHQRYNGWLPSRFCRASTSRNDHRREVADGRSRRTCIPVWWSGEYGRWKLLIEFGKAWMYREPFTIGIELLDLSKLFFIALVTSRDLKDNIGRIVVIRFDFAN
ncbi:hypothetical protein GALMADRAFT_460999 [Galerina marginata CBS 339.88]|uniref:Uncharacterized protein n=1 Tax=Galerina marginata (strain CBS 339.88) TaxID=685588 RepID=A0A067T864_GALM3|nr:hypothetical protein GALMADRAFT_460999 [Galerina marginata CBS 339.88]